MNKRMNESLLSEQVTALYWAIHWLRDEMDDWISNDDCYWFTEYVNHSMNRLVRERMNDLELNTELLIQCEWFSMLH